MTNANEKMNFLISNAKANVNLAAVCFQLIKSAPVDERPKLLEDFFVGYKSTPTTGELKLPITISDEEERKYMIRYGKLVDTHMEELQKQNLSEKDFYAQLWTFICESPVLPNDKARIIALFEYANMAAMQGHADAQAEVANYDLYFDDNGKLIRWEKHS